ncbi:Glyoxalase-like domain-containing protein [Amycolatopsis pretoriensis]|uniref:Glyoxalase-like domain-containing protein n=1 Tax=Amycolatopsis pretoriensis TaxID=218821 RepID=A0A1H5QSQ8_9PSEU|nr:VOC family protein [Amycolatopsis pretoriensis]SEF29105.1 Glyoxalase-like domain-containing protein [Amycolatopsis pretoriensis]
MNIDHTVFLTRDYERTWQRYEQLGFTLSPPSRHFASPTGTSEPVPSCTANRCAYFGGSFLELIGIVDEGAGDPWHVLPILDARGDGLHGCSFGVDDSDEAARRLQEAGLSTSGVLKLQRDVQLPEGTRTARFRSVHIRRDRTPEGILHTAEHLTPEYVHQPRYLDHPNGAKAVAGIVLVVPDDEIAAYKSRYAVITDGQDLVDIVGVTDLLPGETPKELPYFAAHGVVVADLAKARTLVERHVPTTTHRKGFFVRAEDALGAAVYFEQEAR